MKRVKVTEDFYLDEFVTPEIYARFGEKSILWVRPEIFNIAQVLHNRFGKVIINNWADNGQRTAKDFLQLPLNVQKRYFRESGLRTPDTHTGAKYSLHKFGCAADFKFTDAEPEEVRIHILTNQRSYMNLGMRRIEADTPTWLHADLGNTNHRNQILVFKP